MGVSYVVKSYKYSVITFEVDGGKMKDESYNKNEFISELDGNRFHKVELPQQEVTDEDIIKEAIKHSKLYTNKFVPRNAFIMGARWYKEKLKK